MTILAAHDGEATAVDDSTLLLVSAENLARMLNISVRTLWRLRSSGNLPRPVKIGGNVRWRAAEVRQWIEDGCPLVRD